MDIFNHQLNLNIYRDNNRTARLFNVRLRRPQVDDMFPSLVDLSQDVQKYREFYGPIRIQYNEEKVERLIVMFKISFKYLMSKPKILWSGDIVARTGFTRVTENLITRLKDKYEIVVLGNNWWGDPNEFQKDFQMFPSSNRFATEPFGVQQVREITEAVRPDIVFVNNDAWIVNHIYEQIRELHERKLFKFVAYMPMDSYGWTGCLNQYSNAWDGIYVYTKFGAEEFKLSGINKEVGVIPHGITDGQFYPMDKGEVRKKLSIPEDCFVVFNGNRNQARKRIDITIDAFAQFAVGRPDTQLYLHMGMKDQGWDIMALFGREMRKRDIDPNGRIIMTTRGAQPPGVPVRRST